MPSFARLRLVLQLRSIPLHLEFCSSRPCLLYASDGVPSGYGMEHCLNHELQCLFVCPQNCLKVLGSLAGARLQYPTLGGRGLARGQGAGLFAVGGALWPLATVHSDPLWAWGGGGGDALFCFHSIVRWLTLLVGCLWWFICALLGCPHCVSSHGERGTGVYPLANSKCSECKGKFKNAPKPKKFVTPPLSIHGKPIPPDLFSRRYWGPTHTHDINENSLPRSGGVATYRHAHSTTDPT